LPTLARSDRLALVFQRLLALPAASSAKQAKSQLDMTLNQVEDEFTTIPFRPDTLGSDGRMYPAQEDARFVVEGHPELAGYMHRRHETYVSNTGALLIREYRGPVLLDRPGADGKRVEL